MTERIGNKRQMYALLAGGAFGNTIRQFFSVSEWRAHPDSRRYPFWGVRTMTPGGPCRLNCPAGEVEATAAAYAGHAVNVSCMIDRVLAVTLWADVYDAPGGLLVYGIEHPPRGGSWRALMPSQGRQWRGAAARLLLRRHLNASSLADMEAVLERWPGHVYEVSACDRCFGTVPGRNGVVWEVRDY